MAKLPLVSGAYPARSLAAAASECTNLYAETIENLADQAKNEAALYLIPGKHLRKSYPSASTRGLWSGGGRLFAANGLDLVELDQNWNEVSRHTYTAHDDGQPVQILSNGNQLLIISGGQAYCDNGSGPVACRFQLNGQVSAVGMALTWISGDQFTPEMNGLPITIGGHQMLVSAYTDATHITVSGTFGGGSGTVNVFLGNTVFWASGDKFTNDLAGQPITIDGANYTVATVDSDNVLTLVETGLPDAAGVAYSTVPSTLDYQCAGGDLVTAYSAAFLGSTAFVQRPSGGSPDLGRQVNFSGVNDFTVWRGLDFKTKEGGTDYIRSIITDGDLLLILGTEASEAWSLDPQTGQPVRVPGYTQKFGSLSRWGAVDIGGRVYFVGGSSQGGPVAYRYDSAIPTRISTHAEEAVWAEAGLGVNCIAYAYQEAGHTFVVINFGSQAWAWDETEKKWHRRMAWNGTDFAPYTTYFHTFIPEWGAGKHITCGGLTDGSIYESSVLFYDDAGADMAWRRAIPYRYAGGRRIFFGRQQLEMETGTTAAAGAEPTITRDYSDDRGKTFKGARTAGIGTSGDGKRRVFWNQGGQSRGRVWRYFGKGQQKVALVDLEGEEMVGPS